VSILFLLGVFLDYWLGYVLLIRPLLARTSVIVFDRYFHDVLADPLRYRYGGPMWIPEFLSRFVCPPNLLFIVLDANEETILSRKREVPTAELRQQRDCYQRLGIRLMGAAPIRTDQGVEQTVDQASRLVVEHLARRFQRRLARWLALGSLRGLEPESGDQARYVCRG